MSGELGAQILDAPHDIAELADAVICLALIDAAHALDIVAQLLVFIVHGFFLSLPGIYLLRIIARRKKRPPADMIAARGVG